jgi:UPF0176 protein
LLPVVSWRSLFRLFSLNVLSPEMKRICAASFLIAVSSLIAFGQTQSCAEWMRHQGFKNVFQLEGGIIEYTRQVKDQALENKFIGKNFVFDERLGERISDDIIAVCHQCGKPCDDHTNCKNDGCHLLFIQCKECAEKFNHCCSESCQQIIALPHEQQKEIRRGINKGRQVFKKGRSESILFKPE